MISGKSPLILPNVSFFLPAKWDECHLLMCRNVRGLTGATRPLSSFSSETRALTFVVLNATLPFKSLLLSYLLVPLLNQVLQHMEPFRFSTLSGWFHSSHVCVCSSFCGISFSPWSTLCTFQAFLSASPCLRCLPWFPWVRFPPPAFVTPLFMAHSFIIESTTYLVHIFQMCFSVFPTEQDLFGIKYCD